MARVVRGRGVGGRTLRKPGAWVGGRAGGGAQPVAHLDVTQDLGGVFSHQVCGNS